LLILFCTSTTIQGMKIKVIELFAGAGGFRLGLEGWQKKSPGSKDKEAFSSHYEVVWSNQWEPSTKTQHAPVNIQLTQTKK
jgi:DNA (cytosine-5)-methyltransferase 1